MGYVPWHLQPADWHRFLYYRQELAASLAALQRQSLAYRNHVENHSVKYHGIRYLGTMFRLGYTLTEAIAIIRDNTIHFGVPEDICRENGWKVLSRIRSLTEAAPFWEKDPAINHLSPYQRQQFFRRLPTFNNPAFKVKRTAELLLEFLRKPVLGDALLCRLFPELADLILPHNLTRPWHEVIRDHQATEVLLKEVRGQFEWPRQENISNLNSKVEEFFATA